MKPFDKLNDTELSMIEKYIKVNSSSEGDVNLPLQAPLTHILRFWNENKSDLFRIFGNELMLTKRVSVTRPIGHIKDHMSEITAYGGPGYKFLVAFNHWYNQRQERNDLRTLAWLDSLSTNRYDGETFHVMIDDTKKITVSKGCKISKVLGKIAEAFNLDGYEEFRIAHSQCLNQKKLSGDLVISIHPLDYMTMSDNNCGWSSCMSWTEVGDYRQGTVEMMNSAYVVVAYLKGSEEFYIGPTNDCVWNSKKWRQLFIVTPHIITGIREYPYQNAELNGLVLQWLRQLAQENGGWGPYEDTTILAKNYTEVPVASLDRTITLEFSTHYMYNDFYSEHLSYIAPSIPDHYNLVFSGESECMICGASVWDELQCPNLLACDNCESVCYCDDCGERVCYDDLIYVDGRRICPCCYEDNYRECALCEEMHHISDLYTIYLACDNQTSSYHFRVCPDCKDSEQFIKLYGATREDTSGRWWTRTVIDVENFTSPDLIDDIVWNTRDCAKFKACIRAGDTDEI